MLTLRIVVNEKFNRLKGDIRYATKQALDDTAVDVQYATIARLARFFKIRTGWVPGGIVSSKAHSNNLTSAVYLLHKTAEFMWRHAEGAEKPAGNGKQAVPSEGSPDYGIEMPRGYFGERTTLRGKNWPKNLINAIERAQKTDAERKRLNKKPLKGSKMVRVGRSLISGRVFLIEKGGQTTILQRLGKTQLKTLWFLTKQSVTIKKRWDFYDYGTQKVLLVFPEAFAYRMG